MLHVWTLLYLQPSGAISLYLVSKLTHLSLSLSLFCILILSLPLHFIIKKSQYAPILPLPLLLPQTLSTSSKPIKKNPLFRLLPFLIHSHTNSPPIKLTELKQTKKKTNNIDKQRNKKMKGEYGGGDTKSETQNMFSKLHHQNPNNPHPHPHQQQQQQYHHQHHHFSNPFQIAPVRECQPQTSEEEDTSRTSSGTATKPLISDPNNPTGGDGATIEVVRRPRGRPPGSKNKPKPPVIITRDSEPAMSPYILEVPGGSDVVDAVSRFCCRKNIGLVILTGSGTVANVTLRQPSTTPGATVTFHGRFDILSISATFLPQATPSGPIPNGFTISLAGPQGQIVGGLVAGALVAAGTVYIIAASFNNPSYHRLPVEDEPARNSVSGEAHSPPLSTGGESGGHAPAQSCGMAMYSHLPSDVLWAPTARQPPPPPPY